MTPYAVLTCRAQDSDRTIREAFHTLALEHHPDKRAEAQPTERWHEIRNAYIAIKTAKDREAWARKREAQAGLCGGCSGVGTVGSRSAGRKVRLCERCGGEGRLT